MWMGWVCRDFKLGVKPREIIVLALFFLLALSCSAQDRHLDGRYEPYWYDLGCDVTCIEYISFQKDSFYFFKPEAGQRANSVFIKGRYQISSEKIICLDSLGNKAAEFFIPDDTLHLRIVSIFNDSISINSAWGDNRFLRTSKYDANGKVEWGLVLRRFDKKTFHPTGFWIFGFYPNGDYKSQSIFKHGKLHGRQYYYEYLRQYKPIKNIQADSTKNTNSSSHLDSSRSTFTAIEGRWKKGRKHGKWEYYEPAIEYIRSPELAILGIKVEPIPHIGRRLIRKDIYRKGILKRSWVPN
jgi:hypothetical protein